MNNFVHIEIGVTDLELAENFYSGVFKWKLTRSDEIPDYLFFEIDGNDDTLGGAFNLVDHSPSTGDVELYINTDDISKTLEKIVRLGGKMILEKSQLPGNHGFIGKFEDPFGNLLGIWSDT